MHEVFEALELDPKRALKIISKEIEQRAKKVDPSILASLKIVKANVLDRNNRFDEAKDEILGVLEQLNSED